MEVNILGTELELCCTQPMTGYFRDGYCRTADIDRGTHVLCAVMTESFLMFTRAQGNDLSTPRPEWQFPGLQPGDAWCLCVLRWLEAEKAGCAPPLRLEACHQKALEYAPLSKYKAYSSQE
ncbi:DUF2237 domain-containing protein [Flavobacteriaceae bacterium YJPT1-3]|nr:DUF2237 domain-containing protein [Flavobacteriaceae bacterium YJPT1-3]